MTGFADKMTDAHQATTAMGLQVQPAKRSFDGSDVATGLSPSKQQCTIRVGCEAPDYLTCYSETNLSASWYRDCTEYDYQNSATAVSYHDTSARTYASSGYTDMASRCYSTTVMYNTSDAGYSVSSSAEYHQQQQQQQQQQHTPVYQNLTSVAPSYEAFNERVCSSPRPPVQYNGCSREDQFGYQYCSTREDRCWNLMAQRRQSHQQQYPRCNGNSYDYHRNTVGYPNPFYGQNIRQDENGKSYLELGAKSEWKPASKLCSKCGHVMGRSPKPCYRHQRLSVLSLSMLKLNRFRQCSDPSLHRSVLICNTLRHIEDEMEREGLPYKSPASASTFSCDTCCCSNCGSSFAPASSATKPEAPSLGSTHDGSTFHHLPPSSKPPSAVLNDDSGSGDEEARDIDWSSVFSMSTTCDMEPSNAYGDAYLCESSSSAELTSQGSSSSSSSVSSDYGETNSSWKVTSWTSESTDFNNVRWKSDLNDELEGFVHILVGS